MSNDAGIFCNLEPIANKYLLDPDWKRGEGKNCSFGHKTNCIKLSKRSDHLFFNAGKMIEDMFDQIKHNISDRLPVVKNGKEERRAPSLANWDFDFRAKCDPEATEESTSPEVTLERAIIQARRKIEHPCTWTYQMPVATGLFGPNIDKASNIDLVRKRSAGVFDLIELKVGSNNPVYAAVEILQYGLAYVASRHLASKIGYTKPLCILQAKAIELCVLAPWSFYEPPEEGIKYNFAWLEDGLNDALIKFSKKHQVCLTFKFYLLDLNWKARGGPITEVMSNSINAAVDNIAPVPWGDPAKV